MKRIYTASKDGVVRETTHELKPGQIVFPSFEAWMDGFIEREIAFMEHEVALASKIDNERLSPEWQARRSEYNCIES